MQKCRDHLGQPVWTSCLILFSSWSFSSMEVSFLSFSLLGQRHNRWLLTWGTLKEKLYCLSPPAILGHVQETTYCMQCRYHVINFFKESSIVTLTNEKQTGKIIAPGATHLSVGTIRPPKAYGLIISQTTLLQQICYLLTDPEKSKQMR